ncbi:MULTISPECIES: tripartite tricarboxylate transporter permease [Halomonas]|uniref:Tripartite tricarboxylate transporter TctA family protein n=1 Tax=Halomonas chromatireducens TaxID=507626 RepID=A0A120JWY4_9GAMM|nr:MULTISPECIES: tripartite tricarboxylate transporter permease [Halomonas]AMD02738.1 Tripartite tricarboxylate transporter TctA family protein [Halomonas chromatireducens]MBZ0330059.1 tripartite tricarboxylate transporter permease [Halomonas sp. ANAO-440]
MESLNNLMYGFGIALEPMNIAYVFAGVFAGTIIGMLPGLGPISALALMIPITFAMEPSSGLILMAGVYYGAIFGGSSSSILLNAPGVAGTVATSFDGYPMAKQGLAGKALAIAAYASFVGGTISIVFLMLVAPMLSKVAVSFGPAEYFSLMVLGLTAVVSLSDKSLVKGLIAAVIGVMISIMGIDLQTGTERFTFGTAHLLDGIDFLVVALGIFALAEVFYMLLRGGGGKEQPRNAIGSLKLSRSEVREIAPPIARSSVLGFFTGVLPGAGATIGSFLGYSMEKRLAKDGDTFGKGNIKGVAAPEAANNAACTGSFVPLLTLGVPGSGTTAVLLGALLVMGVSPGPAMLVDRPDVFWGVIASMYIGNIFLLVLNLPLIPYIAKILEMPRPLLLALILIFCMVGVYGMSFSVFDLLLLLGFGLVGLGMRLFGFPAAPLILALILGAIMEESMRRALQISGGDWMIFIDKPISMWLLIIAALSLLLPVVKQGLAKARRART